MKLILSFLILLGATIAAAQSTTTVFHWGDGNQIINHPDGSTSYVYGWGSGNQTINHPDGSTSFVYHWGSGNQTVNHPDGSTNFIYHWGDRPSAATRRTSSPTFRINRQYGTFWDGYNQSVQQNLHAQTLRESRVQQPSRGYGWSNWRQKHRESAAEKQVRLERDALRAQYMRELDESIIEGRRRIAATKRGLSQRRTGWSFLEDYRTKENTVIGNRHELRQDKASEPEVDMWTQIGRQLNENPSILERYKKDE